MPICGVALQTAPLNVCIIRLAVRFLRALHLNIFEQPLKFFKKNFGTSLLENIQW
jgi:hypothetical protein